MRKLFVKTVQGLLLAVITVTPVAASGPLTVWLMPSEEAEARATSDPAVVKDEIALFNANLQGSHVRVLNTLPPLDAQLIVVNPAFAVPNWAWVKNQTETIRALQQFAARHHVDVDVRFQTWDQIFRDLDSGARPDVVQIGTTWAAYFASRHLIVPRRDYRIRRGDWRDVSGVPACVLPYINDIRLFFYWKRLPVEGPSSDAFSLNASDWDSALNSLKQLSSPGNQMAFAGGVTLNLLMDYSMLVWAGGTEPISKSLDGFHADLTSDAALRVPRLLTRAAASGSEYPLVVIPEESHQALSQQFVAGQYRVTIEPANFISRWKKDFDKSFRGTKRFWDHAAVAAPPQTFRGGSYLAVMASRDQLAQAFDLAEFLATDDEYTKVLALNAQLPSLRSGFGMDALVSALGASDREAAQFTNVVQQANIKARSLPDLAIWPTEIESPQVLGALQKIWRRIGEGDLEGVQAAAGEAETALNLRIDPLAQILNGIRRFAWLIGAMIVCVLGALVVLAWARGRTMRRLIILLHAYRDSRHANARILGANLCDLVASERDGTLEGKLVDAVSRVAEHYRTKLVPFLSSMGDGFIQEIQGNHEPTGLPHIVSKAFDGAIAHYTAERPTFAPPSVSLSTKGLDHWRIDRFPTVAIAILYEWILNSLRAIPPDSLGTIFVELEHRKLIVESPGRLTDAQLETLRGPRRTGPISTRGRGLEIIRDLAYCAFHTHVAAVNEGQQLRFEIILPLKKEAGA
jgi:hypothetical protein